MYFPVVVSCCCMMITTTTTTLLLLVVGTGTMGIFVDSFTTIPTTTKLFLSLPSYTKSRTITKTKTPTPTTSVYTKTIKTNNDHENHELFYTTTTTTSRHDRREFLSNVFIRGCTLGGAAAATIGLGTTSSASAATTTSTSSSSGSVLTASSLKGNLSDLPPDAVRSYLQYRFNLQLSADYYVFELQNQIQDIQKFGLINEVFTSNGGGNGGSGGGNPSRMEREFTNIFRIISLSMPPDEADLLRDAQFQFEKSMTQLSKVTYGIRRDLPVEIDTNVVYPLAYQHWDEGRIALNEYFTLLNTITGLNEMKIIPPPPPAALVVVPTAKTYVASTNYNNEQQLRDYGRSERQYVDFKKKLKLCQNRGGPTLSQAWGTLMVSGYMQDSCGIPDLEAYFYQ